MSIEEKIKALLQECGYTVKPLSAEGDVFWSQKKKALKVAVIEKWVREDFKRAIDLLLETREGEEGDAYKVVVSPGNEVSSGGLQPIEVIARRYHFCNENGINIWGLDNQSGDLFLVSGSLPQFDFKLLSKLMQSKSMLSAGAQKVIENRIRNFLVRGFHTWDEFENYYPKGSEGEPPLEK